MMGVVELSMLMICGHTTLDEIRNENIQMKVSMTPIEEKMSGYCLKWLIIYNVNLDAPMRRNVLH